MFIRNKLDKINIKTDYMKNGIECCLDIFRAKLVQATKEEIVRQKTALYFCNMLDVPQDMIYTEDSLSHWGINSRDRADIIIGQIIDSNAVVCLGVIECKSSDIILSAQTFEQCHRYAESLGGKYIFTTNGIELFCWVIEDDEIRELKNIPNYSEMINSENTYLDYQPFEYKRHSLEELELMTVNDYKEIGIIGEDTPKYLWKHIINFNDCLLDCSCSLENIKFDEFEIVNDLGIVFRSYRDASGSNFGTGMYRTLIIKDSLGNSQMIGLSIQEVGKTVDDVKYGSLNGKSVLVVSFQDENKDYTVLQLNLNIHMKLSSNQVSLWHNGVIAMKGANKEEFIAFIKEKYPYLIVNNKIYLGNLSCSDLISFNSQDVVNTIENIIKYAFIRNDYKKSITLKNKKCK